jgi:hypothetical protein
MKPTENIENFIRNTYADNLPAATSAKLDQRVLSSAQETLEKSKTTQSAGTGPNIWRIIMKTRITKLAAAAVIIIAVLIGINQFGGSIDGASVAFAKVQETMKTVPWMHVSYIWNWPKRSEYDEYDNAHTKREYWYSYDFQLAMAKFGDGLIAFADYNKGVLHVYNPVTKRITISHLSENSFPSGEDSPWGWVENHVLSYGRHGTPISKRDDEYEGRQVEIYEIVEGNGAVRTQFIVDGQTQLPITEQRSQFEPNGQIGSVQDGTFEYPQNGPEDIYALGVPNEVEVVNDLSLQPTNVLRKAVIESLRNNISKLTSAVLVLRWESKFDGAWSDRPEEKGEQKLWWSGDEEFAAFNTREYVARDENGQMSKTIDRKIIAWNGKVFRLKDMTDSKSGEVKMAVLKEPRLSGNEHFLRDIGWQGENLISGVLVEPFRREPGTYYWSEEDGKNGDKLIKSEFVNLRIGQIGIRYYDSGKGCGLVCYESYCTATRLQSRTTIRYEQVSGGAWFPVEVNRVCFNIQNGEVISHRNTKIDIDKSVFNNPSAIPDGIFELKIKLDAEVFNPFMSK